VSPAPRTPRRTPPPVPPQKTPSSKAGDAVEERLRELETEVLTSPVMRAI